MTLPQFLEKLSKPQITEEVLKLCRLYPEIENYFEEKISEINSEQKMTKNSASENMPSAISSVTRQSSPQEKINLFKSIFTGRDDVFVMNSKYFHYLIIILTDMKNYNVLISSQLLQSDIILL